MEMTMAPPKNQVCMDACDKCSQVCFECYKICLNEPDVAARKNCLSMLIECALICKEASSFMTMDSRYSKDLCGLCSTICNDCAKDCSMFKDEHCKTCADMCRKCADECMKMAGIK